MAQNSLQWLPRVGSGDVGEPQFRGGSSRNSGTALSSRDSLTSTHKSAMLIPAGQTSVHLPKSVQRCIPC